MWSSALSALTAVTPSPLQVLVLGRGFVQLMVSGLEPGAEGQPGREGMGTCPASSAVLDSEAQDLREVILHTPKREKSCRMCPGPRLFSTFYTYGKFTEEFTASALPEHNKKNPQNSFFLLPWSSYIIFINKKNNTRIASL